MSKFDKKSSSQELMDQFEVNLGEGDFNWFIKKGHAVFQV